MSTRKAATKTHTATAGSGGANPQRGKTAWNKFAARARALAPADRIAVNIDVAAAGLVAVGVAGRATRKELHARFKHIAGPEFDLRHLDELEDLGWAAHHVAEQEARLKALATEAKLPASLVKRATEVEGRMQRCCEYYFADDEELGPEVARLKPGVGYRDLASDLLGYAEIYGKRKAIVEQDTKNFVSTDHADAVAIANEILLALAGAMTPEQREITADLSGIWTLLFISYNEVCAAGRFIERADPSAADRYPSLFAATRERPSGRAPKGEQPPAPPAAAGGGK